MWPLYHSILFFDEFLVFERLLYSRKLGRAEFEKVDSSCIHDDIRWSRFHRSFVGYLPQDSSAGYIDFHTLCLHDK